MTLMDGDPGTKDPGTGDPGTQDPGTGGDPGTGDPGGAPTVPEWLSDVEDDSLRSEDALKTLGRFKGKGDLAKSYLELRTKVGDNPIKVPGADASDEERAAFYKAVGRPEKPEEYQFTVVEGIEKEPEMDKAFRETIHKYGLNQVQADGVNLFIANYAKEWQAKQTESIQTKRQETEGVLKKEFGNDYDNALKAANTALEQVFGPEVGQKLAAAGLHVDADIIRGFHRLSKAISEDKLRGMSDTGGPRGGQETREELESMMTDPKYNDPSQRDMAFVRRVEDGFKRLAGN